MAEPQTEKSELIVGLETAVSATPDNVELRLLLVGHLLEGGYHRDALSHAIVVAQAQPDRIEAYRFAAHAAHGAGDPRAAAYERVGRALTAAEDPANETPRSTAGSAPAPPPTTAPVAAVPRPTPVEAPPARASLVPDDAPDAPPHRRAHRTPSATVAVAPAAPETTPTETSSDETVAEAPVEAAAPKRARRSRGGTRKRRQEIEPVTETEIEPADTPEPDIDEDAVPVDEAPVVDATDVDIDADQEEDDEVWEAPEEHFTIAPEEIERPTLTLASIATDAVRDRFEAVVVNPLRYGSGARRSTQGGMLLFGPDGCGKGFFARIVAGELKASFLRVDMAQAMQWPGDPRENIGTVFEAARGALPCVLYLDNIDRAGTHPDTPEDAADRRLLSRLASEITSATSSRGLFVIGGTTAPWDVDMTLLSNGRLDRSLVVLPPDGPAREMILRETLSDAPLSGVELPWIIERTRHFSVDDLVALADHAKALAAINALGDRIVVGPGEMTRAFREVRPAAPSWFSQILDNAVGGGNQDGMYDEVRSYMNANQLV